MDLICPVQPLPVISQPFIPGQHLGVDLAVPVGTQILAPGDGVCSWWHNANDNDAGIHLNFDHDNGLHTREFHLSQLLVNLGDRVVQGQLVALSGNTGLSTGPHCHYEVHDPKGNPIDPAPYLNVWTPGPVPVPPTPQEIAAMALDYILETPDGAQRILMTETRAEGYPASQVTVPPGIVLIKAINQNEVDTAVNRRKPAK
jgi:hypothetical protein